MKLRNTFYIVRHGESIRNVKNLVSCWPEKFYCPLTGRGKKQAAKDGKELKKKKIDLIFCSDLLRTRQTAGIIGKAVGVKPILDKRLREVGDSLFNGKSTSEAGDFWNKREKGLSPLQHYLRRFSMVTPGRENYAHLEKRMAGFLKDIDKRYKGKNILAVGHGRPFLLLQKAFYGWSREKTAKIIINKKEMKVGEIRRLK